MIIPAVPWPPRGPRHCGMPVVALLLRSNSTNCYYGIVNLEYKSGIDQSDVDLDWAHVKDSAPHVSFAPLNKLLRKMAATPASAPCRADVVATDTAQSHAD